MNLDIKYKPIDAHANGLEALGSSKVIRFLKFEKSPLSPFDIELVSDKLEVKKNWQLQASLMSPPQYRLIKGNEFTPWRKTPEEAYKDLCSPESISK